MANRPDHSGEGALDDTSDARKHRNTAVDLAVEAIRERILAGEYPEGTPLRQDVIAAAVGVSPIPVREALRQLDAEGLVTYIPHRGAVVSSLSLEEIWEACEVRALLEGDLIRRAVPRFTAEIIERADAILETFEAAFEAGDVAEWGALNWRFHSTLLWPANRPLTMRMLLNLHNQSDRYTRMQLALTHGESRAAEEHRAIAAAARERDVEGIYRLLTEHIICSGTSLIEWLAVQRARVPVQAASKTEVSARSSSV